MTEQRMKKLKKNGPRMRMTHINQKHLNASRRIDRRLSTQSKKKNTSARTTLSHARSGSLRYRERETVLGNWGALKTKKQKKNL